MNTNKKEQKANINEGFLRERGKEQPTEPELAPITKEKLGKRSYISTSFSLNYDKIREEFFAKVPVKAERRGGFDRGSFSAFCLSVYIQLSKDTEATGRTSNLKKSKYLYGKALNKVEYVPLRYNLKRAIEGGYGITNEGGYRHREELLGLIEALDRTPIEALNDKGDGRYCYLCKDLGGTLEKYKKAEINLYVNKAFCELVEGYGAFFDDTMSKITALIERGENTEIERSLLFLLLHQDHSKPHTENIENLMRYIGKYDELKKNKKRAVSLLLKAINRLIKVGVLKGFEFDENNNIIFYFPSRKKAISTGAEEAF